MPEEYRFTVPNGVYQVTLEFTEFVVNSADTRVFRIAIEGDIVEDALDVYAAAGNGAIIKRVYTATVADEHLGIVFARNGGSPLYDPIISTIEVVRRGDLPSAPPTPTPYDASTATPTPTPTATTGAPAYQQRINCGGITYTDTAGRVWMGDKAYQTDSWGFVSGNAGASFTEVSGTDDDLLYQTYRDAPEEYRFTVPDGLYVITLRFAEFAANEPNTRVFRIATEGVTVESALDIYASAGKAAMLVRTYQANVTDGLLTIAFDSSSGGALFYNPVVSAIEIQSR